MDEKEMQVICRGHLLRIATPKGQPDATGEDVSWLLRRIAEARAQMQPPIPEDPDMSPTPVAQVVPPRSFRVGVAESGELMLMIRHPGYGWVAAPLSMPEERGLLSALQEHVSNPQPPATH